MRQISGVDDRDGQEHCRANSAGGFHDLAPSVANCPVQVRECMFRHKTRSEKCKKKIQGRK